MSVIAINQQRMLRFLAPVVALAGLAAFGTLATAGKPRVKSSVAARNEAGVLAKGNYTFQERFIENRGQWDQEAKFCLRTSGLDTWVTESGVIYDFFKLRYDRQLGDPTAVKGEHPKMFRQGHVVKLSFAGSQDGETVGMSEMQGKVNYLNLGSPTATIASVFEETRLVGLYEGVDMRMYVDAKKPRFDLIVHPGADPSAIRMKFDGAESTTVKTATELNVSTSVGSMRVTGLYAYQATGSGRKQVPCSFEKNADGTISYRVGQYDTNKPLVIDPIVWATLLGGEGDTDYIIDVAVDGLVSAYACGVANSAVFPTSIGAYDEIIAGTEGFVTKFAPDASDVMYSTFLGGTGDDACNGIDLDQAGNAYVCGGTSSTNFATTAGAFQTTNAGANDGFVVKLNPSGTAAVYSTLLGGTIDESCFDVKVNATGQAFVCGATLSNDFDVLNAVQATRTGPRDGFVTKFNAAGTGLVYSTYLGGTEVGFYPESAVGIDIDIDDNAYTVLNTNAADAQTTAGVFDRTLNNTDAYVLKLNANGSLGFATFLGGNSIDTAAGIALDLTNNIYLTGSTRSFNFPKSAVAYDKSYNLLEDCFVTKMNRTGTALIYSTFLGTTSSVGPPLAPNYGAYPQSISVDDLGVAHVAGIVYNNSATVQNIPVTANGDDVTYNGPNTSNGGGDAYIEVINESGTGVVYCSYIGSPADDGAFVVGLDGARNAYVGGYTNGSIEGGRFPTTPGAYKEAFSEPGALIIPYEGFLQKVKTRIPITINSLTITPNSVVAGGSVTGNVGLSGPASSGGATVSITNDNASVVSHPSSFLIPEGATGGTFNIDTTPNLTSTQTVNITATVEGDSKTAALIVSPWLTAVTLSNDEVVGGNIVGGRVHIFTAAPTGGIAVTMASTVPSVASVPNVVTVPTGLTTQTFDVTTVGVGAPQTVDITGSYAGLTRTVTLRVIPASLDSISFNPTVVSGGTPTTGKVQLDGNGPIGGAVITLVSSNPSALSVPASVTISEQQSSATFEGATNVVTINTSVTVTATYASVSKQAVVDVLRATLISLALTPDVIQGGNTAIGTVGLDNPAATGGATVALATSNSVVAPVPASVTVPSGSTNTTFDIATTIVASNTVVTITATRGSVNLNANLTVLPVSFSVVVDPDSVVGGQTTGGTVTLAASAPPGGVIGTLSSSNTSLASVPASVSIPAGQSVATFGVGTFPTATTQNVTITATYLTVNATDILTVEAAGPFSVSVNPDTVSGGTSSTGTVTLDGVAPTGGVVVNLSSDVAEAIVPATVTVPAGQTTRTFPITTTQVSGNTVATITASANGKSANATLTINAANLLSIRFNPSRVRGGQSTVMTVTLDAAAPNGGAVVSITSSNPSIANIPSSVTVPAGQTSRSVTCTTRRVSRNLSTQVSGFYGTVGVFTILTVTR